MRKSKEAKQIIEGLLIPNELPGWLLDANLVLDRKKVIFDLTSKLASKTQKLIQVYGQKKNGRKLVVINAVRYFLERHYSDFSDGAFLVDLKEAKSF
jgi:hypothetical protein